MVFLRYTSILLTKLNESKTIPYFKLCSLFIHDNFKHPKSNTSHISTSRFVAFTNIAAHTLFSKSYKHCEEIEKHYSCGITKETGVEITDYFRSLFKYFLKISTKYSSCGVSFGQSDIFDKVTFDNILNKLFKEKGFFLSLAEKNCSISPQASDDKRILHHCWPSTSKTFTSNFKDLWNSTAIKYIKCLKNLDENFLKNFSTMEKESNHRVFVYGTLKVDEPNHNVITQRTGGKAVFVGNAATVKKWPLVIASRYNIPYLLYCEDKGENVVGEVYELDDMMLSKFDEFESHPNYYTRLTAEVQLFSENDPEKKLIRPWIYFLKNFRPELLNLPYLSDYSSKGSHGLEYVSSEETNNPEDVYT